MRDDECRAVVGKQIRMTKPGWGRARSNVDERKRNCALSVRGRLRLKAHGVNLSFTAILLLFLRGDTIPQRLPNGIEHKGKLSRWSGGRIAQESQTLQSFTELLEDKIIRQL